MKLKTFLFATICVVSVTSVISCEKDSTVHDRPADELILCSHDSLSFFNGVEPTETECGCIEHYYCPQCGRYFSDAACKDEIESPVLWGTSLVINAEDYFDFFETAFYEYGFDDEITSDRCALSFIPSLKDILVEKAEDIIGDLFSFTEEEPDKGLIIQEGLKNISDNLLRVESAILGLAEMHEKAAIKQSVDDREKKLFYLRNATHPCFMSVMNEIVSVGKKCTTWSELPADRVENIRSIVNEWEATGIYNGNVYEDCYLNISELLHFFNGFWTSVKSFPELYDELAFRSTPWLHKANIPRMMCRCSDMITLTEAYTMMCLYYHFNTNNISTERIRLFNIEMKKYDSVLAAHPADTEVVASTRWIWRDKSKSADLSPFKLYRDIWHFNDGQGDVIDRALNELAVSKLHWYNLAAMDYLYDATTDKGKRFSIELDQQHLIYDYYRKKGVKDYYQMLTKAGFRNMTPYDNGGRLVFWIKDRHAFGSDGDSGECYGLYFQSQYLYDGKTIPGKLLFRRQITTDCKAIEDYKLTNIREDMAWRMDKDANKPYEITSIGKRTGWQYESLVRDSKIYDPIIF